MIPKFSLLSRNPKKALCGIFCTIAVVNYTKKILFDFKSKKIRIGASFSKLQKEPRGDEKNSKLTNVVRLIVRRL